MRSILFILILFPLALSAQKYPGYRDSPLAIAQYKYKNTYIKVTYGKPFKRGRKVFGGMIPYGRVWRTGANEATEITITQDIYFGPKFVKAGTYSIFSIPMPDKFVIILNKELGQFGAFEYDRRQDLLRIEVKTEVARAKEDFTIDFRREDSDNGVNMIFWWDTVRLKVPIKILR